MTSATIATDIGDIEVELYDQSAPKATANFVNVSGEGDLVSLDFFYVHPAKVARLLTGQPGGDGVTRDQETVYIRSEPVARVALPLTTAADFALALIERIDEAMPQMREVLAEFAEKLHELSHGEANEHHHEEEGDAAEEHHHGPPPRRTPR